MWSIIQHLIDPLYRWFYHLRVPIRVVVFGNATDLGMVRTTMRTVLRWYQDKAGIILQPEYELRSGINPREELIRSHNALHGDPTFTIYVLAQGRLEGGAIGRASEAYITIAKNAITWPEIYAHELGHAFSLHHSSGGLMDINVTPLFIIGRVNHAQIKAMRKEARLYAR